MARVADLQVPCSSACTGAGWCRAQRAKEAVQQSCAGSSSSSSSSSLPVMLRPAVPAQECCSCPGSQPAPHTAARSSLSCHAAAHAHALQQQPCWRAFAAAAGATRCHASHRYHHQALTTPAPTTPAPTTPAPTNPAPTNPAPTNPAPTNPPPAPSPRYYVRELQEVSASQVELFLNSVPILSPLTRDDKVRLAEALEPKVGSSAGLGAAGCGRGCACACTQGCMSGVRPCGCSAGVLHLVLLAMAAVHLAARLVSCHQALDGYHCSGRSSRSSRRSSSSAGGSRVCPAAPCRPSTPPARWWWRVRPGRTSTSCRRARRWCTSAAAAATRR
jgi:hypothetical protein